MDGENFCFGSHSLYKARSYWLARSQMALKMPLRHNYIFNRTYSNVICLQNFQKITATNGLDNRGSVKLHTFTNIHWWYQDTSVSSNWIHGFREGYLWDKGNSCYHDLFLLRYRSQLTCILPPKITNKTQKKKVIRSLTRSNGSLKTKTGGTNIISITITKWSSILM